MSEWKAMIPAPAEGRASSSKRLGFAFGYRFFLFLLIGFLFLVPAFADRRFAYALLLWDFLVLAAWAADLAALPKAADLGICRSWNSPLALSVSSAAVVTATNHSKSRLHVQLWDAIPWSLRKEPPQLEIKVPGHAKAEAHYTILPSRRGTTSASTIHLRYEGMFRLAQRWASV